MKIEDITFSPYKIHWVEFTPDKGCVTAHDQKQFGFMITFPKLRKVHRWFPTKPQAVEFLTRFNKKLDKNYTCLICTDKQFGMADENEDYEIQFTEAQKKEVYHLYAK